MQNGSTSPQAVTKNHPSTLPAAAAAVLFFRNSRAFTHQGRDHLASAVQRSTKDSSHGWYRNHTRVERAELGCWNKIHTDINDRSTKRMLMGRQTKGSQACKDVHVLQLFRVQCYLNTLATGWSAHSKFYSGRYTPQHAVCSLPGITVTDLLPRKSSLRIAWQVRIPKQTHRYAIYT